MILIKLNEIKLKDLELNNSDRTRSIFKDFNNVYTFTPIYNVILSFRSELSLLSTFIILIKTYPNS